MRIWWFVGALCVLGLSCSSSSGGGGSVQMARAELTFLGVAQWLVQYGDTTVLLDAYFSRPETGAEGSTEEGLDLMQRVLDAAGVESIDFILVGHSHLDHAIDCGSVAMRTGAQVIGSKTTCLVAQAEGLPEDRCTVVGTGDELQLGEATMRAVRTIHFLPESIGRFAELEEVPTLAETWAAPTGGPLSYLLSFPGGEPFSIFHTSSIAPIDGDDGSGEDYAANLDTTFNDVDGTTLWLSSVSFLSEEEDLTQYFSRVRPEFVIPQHFDGLATSTDLEAGLMTTFAPSPALMQVAADEGSTILAPEEYFDVFIVSPDGVTRSDEAPVQEAFGL
jgi:L-ascorbate metabolism protein UlaG (beta-lactamase superfamily)